MVFQCKMCGAPLNIAEKQTIATCEYCKAAQTLPKFNGINSANLYERANHFRRNNEYDKAESIYEQILLEDTADAEAYWSLVLCRHGIEYIKDSVTHTQMPTVNRAQYTSIFDDENYKLALQYADEAQKAIYEKEAMAINEIQKGILAISQKEAPFDVFICYKETDTNGRRTQDSVLANDLYHQLTNEGFKVFFSRITLEDKLGTAYEPYIFAALNSAKVMVVLGTRQEYFNAVWVKNEWSRYLSVVKNSSGKKALIPAYRDMDPYDLPDEFAHLQAQDMSKLGFMQDLIRGIKKIINDNPKSVIQGGTQSGGTDKINLLKRIALFLSDGDWKSANEYCEKVLDIDSECAEAYMYKLMVDTKSHNENELANATVPYILNNNYNKIMLFGNDELKTKISKFAKLTSYNYAIAMFSRKKYVDAKEIFDYIPEYNDSKEKAAKCNRLIQKITVEYAELMDKKRQKEKQILDKYKRAMFRAKLYRLFGFIGFFIGGLMLAVPLFFIMARVAVNGATIGLCFGGFLIMIAIVGPTLRSKGDVEACAKHKERASNSLWALESKYKPTQAMIDNVQILKIGEALDREIQ